MYPIFGLFVLFAYAAAKTDLAGCTTSDMIAYGGASVLWYVPGTGEICDFLDCGGGRAPIGTTVPGCPQYSGTATYSPSYISGYKDGSVASSISYVAATTTDPSITLFTGSVTTTGDSSTSLPTSNSVASSDFTLITGTLISSSSSSATSTASTASTESTSISTPVSSSGRPSSSPTSTTSSGTAASPSTSISSSVNITGRLSWISGVVAAAVAILYY